MSASHKNVPLTESHKKSISIAMKRIRKNYVISEKCRQAQAGKTCSCWEMGNDGAGCEDIMKVVTQTCKHCGEEFEHRVGPSYPTPQFCSMECKAQYFADRRKVKQKLFSYTCINCGKVFQRGFYKNATTPRYCNTKCRWEFAAKAERLNGDGENDH